MGGLLSDILLENAPGIGKTKIQKQIFTIVKLLTLITICMGKFHIQIVSCGGFAELQNGLIMNKYLAEFIGTFWLVFGGCGSAIFAATFPELRIGFLGVALAFGLTVLTGAFALGHISGGRWTF